MIVVIGSKNSSKIAAVEAAFSRAFPSEKITFSSVGTESGVRDHPISAEESLTGATNRANQAEHLSPGADYYVGIEGGLLRASERAWEVGWVVVKDSSGTIATGLSAGIEIQGKMLGAIINGAELKDILMQQYNAELSTNFYSLATNNNVSRQDAYEQAVGFALARFLHPEFYKP